MWHSSIEPSPLWVLCSQHSLHFPCAYISACNSGDCYPVMLTEEKEVLEETTLPMNKGCVCVGGSVFLSSKRAKWHWKSASRLAREESLHPDVYGMGVEHICQSNSFLTMGLRMDTSSQHLNSLGHSCPKAQGNVAKKCSLQNYHKQSEHAFLKEWVNRTCGSSEPQQCHKRTKSHGLPWTLWSHITSLKATVRRDESFF